MRLRYNHLHTTLGADLSDSATSVTLAAPLTEGGSNIATVASPDVLVLSVDDEVMHVTAYTSGATTATVTRGEEDTVAASHDQGAPIFNAPTKLDGLGSEYLADSESTAWAAIAGVQMLSGADSGRALDIVSGDGSLDLPYGIASLDARDTGVGLDLYGETASDFAEVYIQAAPGSRGTCRVWYNNSAAELKATDTEGVVKLDQATGGSTRISLGADGLAINSEAVAMGFNGATPVARPEITGSIGTDLAAIVTDLLAALDSLGLITDSTTA